MSFSEPRGHRWFIWHPLLPLIYISHARGEREPTNEKVMNNVRSILLLRDWISAYLAIA
jgi:hypothetical protein